MIVIKYWPILARGSGLFRMCIDDGKVEWEHVTDVSTFGAALLDSNTDENSTHLAPPILEDTDAGVTLSQAGACHQYLGNKLGFNKGISCPELAAQYQGDLNDLHTELGQAAAKGQASNDVAALKAYMTGDRYRRHLGAINRCIKGPFYFGEDPTYVDYFCVSILDMTEGKWLKPLEVKSGDTIEKYSPKLRAVAEKLRAKSDGDPKIANTNPVPPVFVLSQDRVNTWDSEEA